MKKETKVTPVRTMKSFNQTINIEVQVDTIANKLLSSMDDANPHSALIAETIVGTLAAEGRLSGLYNALNGWETTIDFKVGQRVNCDDTQYNGSKRQPIGNCEIIEINEYKSDSNIKVSYEYLFDGNSKELSSGSKWVSIKSLSAWLSVDQVEVEV